MTTSPDGWNPRWNYHLGGEPRSVCACPDGMYEGARPATWPRYCERCGGLMPTTHAPDGGGLTEADLPRRVRDLRMRRGLSLRAAAVEIGMSFNTLTRIEQGYEYENRHNAVLLRWLATDDGSCSACGSTSTAQGLTEAERKTLHESFWGYSNHIRAQLVDFCAPAVDRILAARTAPDTEAVAAALVDSERVMRAVANTLAANHYPGLTEMLRDAADRAAAVREGSYT